MNWNDLIAIITSGFISLIISTIFHEPIKTLFYSIGSRFPRILRICYTNKQITGIWLATFEYTDHYGNLQRYKETIEIFSFMGQILGKTSISETNHPKIVKKMQNEIKTFRLGGKFYGGLYLSGTWYDPPIESSFHGSFHLKLSRSGTKMNGLWVGYSNYSDNSEEMSTGKWVWRKK